jgi:hypothetical protein
MYEYRPITEEKEDDLGRDGDSSWIRDRADLEALQVTVREGIKPQFPWQMIDAKNEVEYSIGIVNREVHITFLGSVSKMDWVHNFMFWKKPYKRMKELFFVHAGFLKIWKIARPHIVKFLLDHASEYDSIHIGGHSLGGAIATLCLEQVDWMKAEGQIPSHVRYMAVTSGAPRVFSIFGHKAAKKRCHLLIRVRYRNDGIPTLPPAIFGYKHVGMLYQYGKKWPLSFLAPSTVYYHDVSCYENFLDQSIEWDESNNWLYKPATTAYAVIYAILGMVGAIVTLLLLTRGGT